MRQQTIRLNKTPSTEVQAGVVQSGVTQTPTMGFVQQQKTKGQRLAETFGMVVDTGSKLAAKGAELYKGQKDEEAVNQYNVDKYRFLEELNALETPADKQMYMMQKVEEFSQPGVNKKYANSFLRDFDGIYNTILKDVKEQGYDAQFKPMMYSFDSMLNGDKTYDEVISEFKGKVRNTDIPLAYAQAIFNKAQIMSEGVVDEETLAKYEADLKPLITAYNKNDYTGKSKSGNALKTNNTLLTALDGLTKNKKTQFKTNYKQELDLLKEQNANNKLIKSHLEKGVKYGYLTQKEAQVENLKSIKIDIENEVKNSNALISSDSSYTNAGISKVGDALQTQVSAISKQLQLKEITEGEAKKQIQDLYKTYQDNFFKYELRNLIDEGTYPSINDIPNEYQEYYNGILETDMKKLIGAGKDGVFVTDMLSQIRLTNNKLFDKVIKQEVGPLLTAATDAQSFGQAKEQLEQLRQISGVNLIGSVDAASRDRLLLMSVSKSFNNYSNAVSIIEQTGRDFKKERIDKQYLTRYDDIINSLPSNERLQTEMSIKAAIFATKDTEAVLSFYEEGELVTEVGDFKMKTTQFKNFTHPSLVDRNGNARIESISEAIENKTRNLWLEEDVDYSIKIQNNLVYIFKADGLGTVIEPIDITSEVERIERNKRGAERTPMFPSLNRGMEKVGDILGQSAGVVGKAVSGGLQGVTEVGSRFGGYIADQTERDFNKIEKDLEALESFIDSLDLVEKGR